MNRRRVILSLAIVTILTLVLAQTLAASALSTGLVSKTDASGGPYSYVRVIGYIETFSCADYVNYTAINTNFTVIYAYFKFSTATGYVLYVKELPGFLDYYILDHYDTVCYYTASAYTTLYSDTGPVDAYASVTLP